jgi:tetratricopeptide (TPR) repeat protein
LQFGDGTETSATSSSDGATAANAHQRRQLECLDALWAIRGDIPEYHIDALMQVDNALQNVFVSMKDWRMALHCLQRMMDLTPQLAASPHQSLQSEAGLVVDHQSQSLSVALQVECLSRQGRILLQAGALDQAAVVYLRASELWKNYTPDNNAASPQQFAMEALQIVPAQLLSNEGLLKFSRGQHNEALESFHSAIQHLRRIDAQRSLSIGTNKTLLAHMLHNCGSFAGTFSTTTCTRSTNLYSETINNMALCALYTCRLPQALHLLESLIRENVTAHLTDRVALNLCTLYELASDTAVSARKKRVLQLVARRFLLHDIKPESFRVAS